MYNFYSQFLFHLLKKVLDYSGRFVIYPEPEIGLDEVTLPWQAVIKLYELFVLHEIIHVDPNGLEFIKNALSMENIPDINDLKRLFTRIVDAPDSIPSALQDYLYEIAVKISKDKLIMYKRDPVENRDSFVCSKIIVRRYSFSAGINPLNMPRMGADCDGDALCFYPLLTEEAQNEAKQKLYPKENNGVWTSVTSITKCPYEIQLDSSTAIYKATKE